MVLPLWNTGMLLARSSTPNWPSLAADNRHPLLTLVAAVLGWIAVAPALAGEAAAEPEEARTALRDSIDRADDVAGRAEPTLAAKDEAGPRRVTRKERLSELASVRPFPTAPCTPKMTGLRACDALRHGVRSFGCRVGRACHRVLYLSAAHRLLVATYSCGASCTTRRWAS